LAYTNVREYKHLSEKFPFQNGLIQGKALLTLLLNFASDYAIRKDQENQEEMDLTRTHRPLIYADHHLLKENINNIKRNTALSDTSKKTDLKGRSQHRDAHVSATECMTNLWSKLA
jgi:hypothetical protein